MSIAALRRLEAFASEMLGYANRDLENAHKSPIEGMGLAMDAESTAYEEMLLVIREEIAKESKEVMDCSAASIAVLPTKEAK